MPEPTGNAAFDAARAGGVTDTFLSFPDVKEAKAILDADHYNLEKVKDRILEYLSVRKLNKKMKGPILCFVGPPGVGKTSLGQSIATAQSTSFLPSSTPKGIFSFASATVASASAR